MKRSKACLISGIVLFAIGIVLFIIALFLKDGNIGNVLCWVGAAFATVAVILVFIGTVFKVKENNEK